MHLAASFLSALVIVVAPLAAAGMEPGPIGSATSLDPQIEVLGATAETGAIVDAAIATFLQNDLELPNLQINLHSRDKSKCHGFRAYWQPGTRHDTIDMCFIDRFTMLHELAHSFVGSNVDNDTLVEFLALTPGQVWQDDDVKYSAQGIEDAADTIARVLIRGPRTINIVQNSVDLATFDLLTRTSDPDQGLVASK